MTTWFFYTSGANPYGVRDEKDAERIARRWRKNGVTVTAGYEDSLIKSYLVDDKAYETEHSNA